MNGFDPANGEAAALQRLNNPAVTREDLAAIAGAFPNLRPAVAAHPLLYPELGNWLASLGRPDVDAALANRGGSPAPAAPEPAPAPPGRDPSQQAPQRQPAPQRRKALIIAGCAVGGAILVAGIALAVVWGSRDNAVAPAPSPSPSASPKQASPTPKPTPTPTPTPTAPATIEAVLSEHDWYWRGAMLMTDPTTDPQSGIVEFGVWAPGMDMAQWCSFSPVLGPGQTMHRNFGSENIHATYDPEPQVVMGYSVLQAADGLTPQRHRHFVLSFDPSTCAVGPAVELANDEAGWATVGSVVYVEAGSHGAVIVEVYVPTFDPVYLALDPATKEILWTTAQGPAVRLNPISPDAALRLTHEAVLDPIVSLRTGEVITTIKAYDSTDAESPRFCSPSQWLSMDDQVSVIVGDHCPSSEVTYWMYSNAGGPVPIERKADVSCSTLLGVTTRPDDSSGVVLCRASDSALLSVDSTGAFATILSADQVDALAIQVRGWSNGNLYVETTDEHIVITLDGQENGYWASTYPFSEATIGGRLYTVWFNEDTRVYTLTSDGVRPGY